MNVDDMKKPVFIDGDDGRIGTFIKKEEADEPGYVHIHFRPPGLFQDDVKISKAYRKDSVFSWNPKNSNLKGVSGAGYIIAYRDSEDGLLSGFVQKLQEKIEELRQKIDTLDLKSNVSQHEKRKAFDNADKRNSKKTTSRTTGTSSYDYFNG